MPQTDVVFFREEDGTAPLLRWLDELPRKAQNKCLVRIERLAELGHEIRRPEADTLRDGIHELRAALRGIQYRMLYFFHERLAVLSHGVIKEKEVPPKEIDRAVERKTRFASNPEKYTYEEGQS